MVSDQMNHITVNGRTNSAANETKRPESDEVITQPLTFVATCNAIAHQQAVPCFVDVDPGTLGMSPEALWRFLTTHAERAADGRLVNRKTGRRLAADEAGHRDAVGLQRRDERAADEPRRPGDDDAVVSQASPRG